MYVKQKYKFIFSFIFIFIFVFFSFTIPFLETTVNAEVVTLSVGAAYAIMGAIASGVVFKDAQSAVDYSNDFLESFNPGYKDARKFVEEFERELKEKYNNGGKPPNPKNNKNRFIPLMEGASISSWGTGVLDFWRNKQDNNFPTISDITINTPNGTYVFGSLYRSSSNGVHLTLRRNGGPIEYLTSWSGFSPDDAYRHHIGAEILISNGYLQYKAIYYLDGKETSRWNVYSSQKYSVGNISNNIIILRPEILPFPGINLPSSFPQELNDFKYPIPYPQIPEVPNPDWSDYGIGTEIKTMPQPNTPPDINNAPNSIPLHVPSEYPDIDIFELDSGIDPKDFVNMDLNQLNQYLQNNVYNNTTNNNTTIVNPGIEIEDGPFDVVDFDFEPLKDVGTALVTRFPFCIPFDFIESIKVIAGDSDPPSFSISMPVRDQVTKRGYEWLYTIDFSMFEKFALISRIFTTLIFVVVLMFATSRMIKW